ncbi:uncharacterized protein [Venturia canescens]|uniref:uncharacterized protein n=1 Tax=Venturia canescens TaxID=32260 RepID=UPI001C9CE9F3|nr:uncharacterized protein LOC122416381 [Venturia canescens]
MFFGEIDPNNKEIENSNLFYFMRTSEEGIPAFESYEDCNKRITNYLIVGSLNGNLLPAMNMLLVHAFKPLVENQYRGLGVAQQHIEEIHSGTKSDETPMGRANATLSTMIDNQV